MKVLHISKYYYPFSGGTEQIARDIVTSLKDVEGLEQIVFAFDHNSVSESKDYEDEVDGIKIIRCRCIAKISSQSIAPTYNKRLVKTMEEFKPDVVILHYPNPFATTYLLRELKKFPDTKLITYWHLDIYKQKILKNLFIGQNNRLLARSNTIVATSPKYLEASPWLSKAKEKCIVIPNCINEHRLEVDDAVIARAKEIREANKGKIICLAVGRHVEYKGFRYLIDTSRILDDRFAIHVTGRGPLTLSLKQLAQGDDKISILGLVSNTELKAQLLACDIFCFPSVTKNEAFGLALAEGMYFEHPAVTFTIPGSGVNYVSLDGITGIECPNGDVAAYAKALTKLADDPDLIKKYGQAAKQRVLDNFTYEIFKQNIIELITKG